MLGWPALVETAAALPPRTGRQHARAAAAALFVTFLWSTSWVLIKVGLDGLALAPLSFAGLRYALAAVVVVPLAAVALRRRRPGAEAPDRGLLGRVALYGLVFVTVAQGAQFAALSLLPATAVSLVLSLIPAVVAGLAIVRREERASPAQAGGIALLGIGAFLYFGPADLGAGGIPGLGAALVCVAAAAVSAHLGRSLARDASMRLGGPVGLTGLSVGGGAVALLAAGVFVEGVPALDARGWALVGWLAIVNTAFAFVLWNAALRTLTAVESSVLNNTMLIQIAILAVVLLDERLEPVQVAGLAAAAAGALVVQLAPALLRRRATR